MLNYAIMATMKRRIPRGRSPHFGVIINRKATRFKSEVIESLISALRRRKAAYTIFEPNSAADLLRAAETALGMTSAGEPFSGAGALVDGHRRKFTALISCGGDGTFNLVSRPAIHAEIPVGILPLGRQNNIARSLYGDILIGPAIERILSGKYLKIDMGRAAGQPFFGSLGIGFIPNLEIELEGGSTPRYGIGWSKLGSRVAASLTPKKTIIKVDSYQFEAKPLILNINLLNYSAGLPLSPASLHDDGQAEIIFDQGDNPGEFSSFTRLIYKEKYLYGSKVRLYRGREIHCHPVKGRQLYLDGEIIKLPTSSLDVRIGERQLKVLCG